MVRFTEDEVVSRFGNKYDQPKSISEQDSLEDSQSGQPHRYLSKWCLLKRSKKSHLSEKVRHSLPDGCTFSSDYILRGSLVPANEENSQIEVVVSKLKLWVLNRSVDSRGIWIESSKAWYQLKDPDKISPTIMVTLLSKNMPCSFPSQEQIHAKLRANFSLMSNLVDILSESHHGKRFYNISKYAKWTPLELHTQLTNSHSDRKSTSNIESIREPFDYQLLQKSAAFCRRHLLNFHPLLKDESTFMKGLDDLIRSSEVVVEVDDDKEHQDYIRRAENAERRSGRTAWGDKLAETERKIKTNIEKDSPSLNRSSTKKRRRQVIDDDSDSSDEEEQGEEDNKSMISPKKQRLQRKSSKVTDVSNSVADILGYENDVTILSPPGEKISQANMAKAKIALAKYLTPTPTDNENEDYTIFSIEDDNMQDIIEEVLFNVNVPSMEFMLILVESIRTGGKKMMKGIFKKNKSKGMLGGDIIFKKWLCCALELIQDRCDDYEDSEGHKVEILLVVGIMNLIYDFHVIKDAKQLSILKSKFNIDWQDIVEKTLTFSEAYEIDGIIKSCKKAKAHLDQMMGGANDDKNKKNIKSPKIEKASEEKIIDLTTMTESAPPIIDVDSEKNEKDRLRRARMAQMLKAAKCRAGTSSDKENDSSMKVNYTNNYTNPSDSSQQEFTSTSEIERDGHNQRDSWNHNNSENGTAGFANNGSGWNKEKNSNDNSGNFGGKSNQSSSSSAWNAKAIQSTNSNTCDTKPTQSSGSDAWNAKSSQSSRANDWHTQTNQSSGSSAWNTKSSQSSSSNAWDAKPSQSPRSNNWGAQPNQSSGSNGWDRKPTQSSSSSAWDAKPSQNSSSNSWGAQPNQSSGGWGSSTSKSPISTWTSNTPNSAYPDKSTEFTGNDLGKDDYSFTRGDQFKKISRAGSPYDNEPAVNDADNSQKPNNANKNPSWKMNTSDAGSFSHQGGERRPVSSSDRWSNKEHNDKKDNGQRQDDFNDRDMDRKLSHFSRGENGERSRNNEYKYKNDRVESSRENEIRSFRNKPHNERGLQRDTWHENNMGNRDNGSNEKLIYQRNTMESKDGRMPGYSSRSHSERGGTSSDHVKDPEGSTSEDGEIEENQSSSGKNTGRYQNDQPRERELRNVEQNSKSYNDTKWSNTSSKHSSDNSSYVKSHKSFSTQNTSTSFSSNATAIPPRGRGRGRGLTLPAWMTRKDGDNLGQAANAQIDSKRIQTNDGKVNEGPSSNSSNAHEKDRNFNRSSNQMESRFQKNDQDNGSSFGRNTYDPSESRRRFGHESDTSMENRGRGRGGGRGQNRGSNRGRGSEGSDHSWKQNNNDGSFNPAPRARGRGRGKEQTLPAWMTQKR